MSVPTDSVMTDFGDCDDGQGFPEFSDLGPNQPMTPRVQPSEQPGSAIHSMPVTDPNDGHYLAFKLSVSLKVQLVSVELSEVSKALCWNPVRLLMWNEWMSLLQGGIKSVILL